MLTRPTAIRPPQSSPKNYTRTLVIASLKEDDTLWIERELRHEANLQKAVYIVNDNSSAFHVPLNKGHEVMVYLTYIINHYDKLPDVAMFMHSHQHAWHNNDLLDQNAANIIKRLSLERVLRVGYMNLRCTLRPGCPSHLHPANPVKSLNHPEEIFWPKAWNELFPVRPIPHTVSQSCCGQFAVSRDHILKIPWTEYNHFRDWLIHTELEDSISGRIWEYMWQILFSGENEFCPPENVCLCDGYGICFGSEQEYDGWMNKTAQLKSLKNLGEKNEEEISRLEEEINAEKARAFQRGEDPKLRAIEVRQQCLDPNSASEWNTAAIAWQQSLACLREEPAAVETWEVGD